MDDNFFTTKYNFITYHFPWLSASTLRYAEALLMRSVEIVPPVLDLGCGDGSFSWFAFKRKFDYGLDIKLAPNSSYYAKTYNNVLESRMQNIPLSDKSVNTVISNCVMEHVDEIAAALKEINRVLIKDGLFVLTVPNKKSETMSFMYSLFLTRPFNEKWLEWYNAELEIVNFFSAERWNDLLEEAGFNVLMMKGYVDKHTMFWHTLFATLVLLGKGIMPTKQKKVRKDKLSDTYPKNFSGLRMIIAKAWFKLLGKGYTRPLDPSEGGYLFILCRKK